MNIPDRLEYIQSRPKHERLCRCTVVSDNEDRAEHQAVRSESLSLTDFYDRAVSAQCLNIMYGVLRADLRHDNLFGGFVSALSSM